MDLSKLAIKQKRLNFLQSWVDRKEVHDEAVKVQMIDLLKVYRNLLATCWEKKECDADDESKLQNLDRQLRNLHEESRLRFNLPAAK